MFVFMCLTLAPNPLTSKKQPKALVLLLNWVDSKPLTNFLILLLFYVMQRWLRKCLFCHCEISLAEDKDVTQSDSSIFLCQFSYKHVLC